MQIQTPDLMPILSNEDTFEVTYLVCQVKTLKTLEGEFSLFLVKCDNGQGGEVIVISTILLIYLLDLAEFIVCKIKSIQTLQLTKKLNICNKL